MFLNLNFAMASELMQQSHTPALQELSCEQCIIQQHRIRDLTKDIIRTPSQTCASSLMDHHLL